jgi:hypothetical protein
MLPEEHNSSGYNEKNRGKIGVKWEKNGRKMRENGRKTGTA